MKILIRITILCYSVLCLSCQAQNGAVEASEESLKCINDIFLDAIDTSGYYGSLIIPAPPPNTSSEEEKAEYKREFGTSLFSIGKVPVIVLRNKLHSKVSEMIKRPKLGAKYDNSYGDIIEQVAAIPLNSDSKSLGRLSKHGKYKLINHVSKKLATNEIVVGEISFSNVYFNETKDKAIVYMENSCGSKCGGGYLLLLSRNENTWKLVDKVMLWIS